MNAYELAECKAMLIDAGYDDASIETTKHGLKITTNNGSHDFVKMVAPEPGINPVWIDMESLLEGAPEPEHKSARDAIAAWLQNAKP